MKPDTTTVVHIYNLHCSSCVASIEEALSELNPPPSSVDISIVIGSVTVVHSKEISSEVIQLCISDAGFDVAESSSLNLTESRRRKHVEQCQLCREGAAHHGEVCIGTTGPYKVTLSIGGMTCAACSSTITQILSDFGPQVRDVSISLLDNSGHLIVDDKKILDQLCEAVEDAGYEAQVASIEPEKKVPDDHSEEMRTVTLRIDAFCQHCPQRVMSALSTLGDKVIINKPMTSYTEPLVTLSYRPLPPSFTLRTITAAISSSKSPEPFKVTIYHPPTLEERSRRIQKREQFTILARLIFAFIVAIPTFTIGIVYMTLVPKSNPTREWFMQPIWKGNVSRAEWALFFLATPVMFFAADIFHKRSFKELRALWRRNSKTPYIYRFIRFGSMNLLVSMGVSIAYFASIALLALAASEDEEAGDETTYFDAVVFLTMFLLAGRYLESYSKAHTADAITALASLRPATALVQEQEPVEEKGISASPSPSPTTDLEKGDPYAEVLRHNTTLSSSKQTKQIPIDFIEIGDIVLIPNGSTPPADGTLLSGGGIKFDESSLTGESRLVSKTIGDKVFLGTVNKSNGVVKMRVDKIGGMTMLDGIIKVVREGQTRRAPIERIADLITSYFVPLVTLLAVLTWMIWLILGYSGALPDDYLDTPNRIGGWALWSLKFSIAVFVVACPCGIGLAAPTALLVGSGIAAKYGILARGGGEAFQEISQLDVIVFDKTGTLTEGTNPSVGNFEFFPVTLAGWTREGVLGYAKEVESASSHPLGSAIRAFAEKEQQEKKTTINIPSPDYVEERPGRGLVATFTDLAGTVVIGNEVLMTEHGVEPIEDNQDLIAGWKSMGQSVVLVAVKDSSNAHYQLVGAFGISDALRPEAPQVVKWIQQQGIETWMISGDNAQTAAAVAKQVGIPPENVMAGVLPEGKADKIKWLQENNDLEGKAGKRRVVGMVGDGINDAPALAIADAGIAIGSGSDVAISSASFILLSSHLKSLVTLFDLSKKTIRRIKFNFAWALVYNLLAVPIAAGVIYPAGHARLDPVWASLAMALSSVSVICSSLLLRLYREPKVKYG